MKEKIKFIAGGVISAVLLFGLAYVGVQSVLKKRFQNKTPDAPVVLPDKPVVPVLTPEEKLKELEKKAAKNPKNAHLRFLLAEEYRKAGKKILALLEYRKSMELNPKSKDAEKARAWIEQETLFAKEDWRKNVSIRYQLSMQLESYQSITGSLASISQAVALRDQQFQASAAAGAAATTGLTPAQQAGATGSQLPSFAPGTAQPMMFMAVPVTQYAQPGAPPANPSIGVPTPTPPPAGYAPTQQPPPAGQQPSPSQLPPGFTTLQPK